MVFNPGKALCVSEFTMVWAFSNCLEAISLFTWTISIGKIGVCMFVFVPYAGVSAQSVQPNPL